MPDKKLIIIGDGRLKEKLRSQANENIIFKGYLPRVDAMDIVSKAKAFVFMPKEDFGIVPIEAQACGTPVIAYGKGGAKETIFENKTGLFVKEQTKESLIAAILKFENLKILPQDCKEYVQKFSPLKFENSMKDFIKKYGENK